MKFTACQYNGIDSTARNWGVNCEDGDDQVSLELTHWHAYLTEPGHVYMTEREAKALCAMMNDLFANVTMDEVKQEIV